MIKAILFDVDGTMMDTEYVMIASLQQTLKEEKGLDVSSEELNYILGIPGRKAIEPFVETPEEVDSLYACWVANVEKYAHHGTLFPQIEEVVHQLKEKGLLLGIVTSKTEEAMNTEFEPFGLTPLFDCIVTASDTQKHKPEPDPILFGIKQLGLSPDQVIYVGDSPYDMQSAQAAGSQFALAKWGAKEDPRFSMADIVLETPLDLLDYLD